MELDLAPDADGRTVAAVRSAAAQAGLVLAPVRLPETSTWWRAGLEDAIRRSTTSAAPAAPLRYEAVRSPRSTRGATRA